MFMERLPKVTLLLASREAVGGGIVCVAEKVRVCVCMCVYVYVNMRVDYLCVRAGILSSSSLSTHCCALVRAMGATTYYIA